MSVTTPALVASITSRIARRLWLDRFVHGDDVPRTQLGDRDLAHIGLEPCRRQSPPDPVSANPSIEAVPFMLASCSSQNQESDFQPLGNPSRFETIEIRSRMSQVKNGELLVAQLTGRIDGVGTLTIQKLGRACRLADVGRSRKPEGQHCSAARTAWNVSILGSLWGEKNADTPPSLVSHWGMN